MGLRQFFLAGPIVGLLASLTASASVLTTHLDAQTSNDFQVYANKVEATLLQQWNVANNSLEIEKSPDDLKKVMDGQILVHPSVENTPTDVHDGLVHDWTGDVFIPNTSIAKVIALLQDFDHDTAMYPEIRRSRLIRKDNNHVTGYLRVERKTAMVDVVLDVYNDTHYREVAGGRWISEAHADKIQQVQDAGTRHEKLLPPGEGYGFLWRMNNYWVFEARDGGVLIECRNLSLSRAVPSAVAWMINPIVKEQPKISMTSTLLSTRKAAQTNSGKS